MQVLDDLRNRRFCEIKEEAEDQKVSKDNHTNIRKKYKLSSTSPSIIIIKLN